MNWLKYVISAIISVIVSIWLFESSIWAMLVCFCGINMISITSKREVSDWKKERKYKICLGICILGALIIVLGIKCVKNDMVIIVGAMMFATTFAAIVVKDLMEYFAPRG